MKIGLFFGSFNPMHIGHKIIASYMLEFSVLNKIVFVVSPQNPLKQKDSLLGQHHRLMILRRELEDIPNLEVSDIEFDMPKPSYTIDTLVRLQEKNPKYEYSIIMGSDNLQNFHKWKNYKQILKNHSVYVYPRSGFGITESHKNIYVVENVPQMEISAKLIRKHIRSGKDVSYLMPEKAWQYIDEMNFYKK